MQHAPTLKQLRSFGLVVGGIFAIISLWPTLRHSAQPRLWSLAVSAILIGPALLYPASLALPYRAWMAAGQLLAWINTRALLTVLFYLLFLPIGLALRILGKDPLHRAFDPKSSTYRIPRMPRPITHMQRQY